MMQAGNGTERRVGWRRAIAPIKQHAERMYHRVRPVVHRPAAFEQWADILLDHLQNNALPFWLEHGMDRVHGGVLSDLARGGTPAWPYRKVAHRQGRFMWSFASIHRLDPRPAYREAADHARHYLTERMRDMQHGGYYWLTDRVGRLMDGRKHVYGHCFVIYGLAAYSRAFNDPAALEEALALFQLIDEHARSPHGGYREAFTCDWGTWLRGDPMHGSIVADRHSCFEIAVLEMLSELYEV
ncbi:MAG: AGE family epimerase/isomerase, partial [Phycisphaeraceae bacterium]